MTERMTDEDFAHQEHVHCDIPGTHEDLLEEARRARAAEVSLQSLLADRERVGAELLTAARESESRLKAENERLRAALADLLEWAPHDRLMKFDDGDITVEDFISDALSTDKQGPEPEGGE